MQPSSFVFSVLIPHKGYTLRLRYHLEFIVNSLVSNSKKEGYCRTSFLHTGKNLLPNVSRNLLMYGLESATPAELDFLKAKKVLATPRNVAITKLLFGTKGVKTSFLLVGTAPDKDLALKLTENEGIPVFDVMADMKEYMAFIEGLYLPHKQVSS